MTTVFSSCSSQCSPLFAVSPPPPPRLCRHQQPAWNEPNTELCHAHQSLSSTIRIIHPKICHKYATTAITFASRLRLLVMCYLCLFLPGAAALQAIKGELLYDQNSPPSISISQMHLEARQVSSTFSSTIIRPEDVSTEPTATQSSIETATDTMTSMPTPFDANLGNNFTTTSCPKFFDQFLHDQAFIDCLPFSLLLQTSNAFFTTSKSPLRLTQTLNATCSVNFPQCSSLMSSLATQIRLPSTCGPDLSLNNPTVLSAYNGFLSYIPLYRAGCLTDPSTGSYCYSNAITNASAPSSSYIYHLPLGVALPGGSRPACSKCLQDTMGIFAQEAGRGEVPISGVYAEAASLIQMNCGPQFVQSAVERSEGGIIGNRASLGLLGVVALLWFWVGF